MSRRRKLARHPNPRENDRCFWWHDEEQFKGKKDGEVFFKRSSKMSSCGAGLSSSIRVKRRVLTEEYNNFLILFTFIMVSQSFNN